MSNHEKREAANQEKKKATNQEKKTVENQEKKAVANHEKRARELHNLGNNCSISINTAFSEDTNISKDFPAPRSIEGKCGALITAEKILKEKGKEDKIEEFEREFIKRFGYAKCTELMSHYRRCNDYVGESAKMLDELLG